MNREAMVEEVVPEMDQEEVREEWAGVGGSAESDEREAKTQENPHHHPMGLPKKKPEVLETNLQCGISYERWSGDTPRVWKIGRVVQMKIELSVMAMEELTSQIKK